MTTPGLTALAWFVAILALIPLALWLVKRSRLVPGAPGASARTVSVLPLSNSQRVVTVEVGSGDERVWLVLGVTPQSIRTLHTMGPLDPPPPAPGAAEATPFAQLLTRMRTGERRPHG